MSHETWRAEYTIVTWTTKACVFAKIGAFFAEERREHADHKRHAMDSDGDVSRGDWIRGCLLVRLRRWTLDDEKEG